MVADRKPNGQIRPISDYSEQEYMGLLRSRLVERAISQQSGCIEWQGCLTKNGYGQIRVRQPANKLMLAHRLAWTLKYGCISPGFDVCHKCDNRKCINVDHLFIGTRSENMQDMVSKGRQADTRGEKSGKAKLDSQAIGEVKRLCLSGVTQAKVALMYGVHAAHISRIMSKKRWGHT